MGFAAEENVTVLVVDDDAQIRTFIRHILSVANYQVLEAEDGLAAYELLQSLSGGIELLITDVVMPRMDGIALGRKVNTEYPAVEVLYISGFAADTPKYIAPGHFLQKPFVGKALIQSVQSLCTGPSLRVSRQRSSP